MLYYYTQHIAKDGVIIMFYTCTYYFVHIITNYFLHVCGYIRVLILKVDPLYISSTLNV